MSDAINLHDSAAIDALIAEAEEDIRTPHPVSRDCVASLIETIKAYRKAHQTSVDVVLVRSQDEVVAMTNRPARLVEIDYRQEAVTKQAREAPGFSRGEG